MVEVLKALSCNTKINNLAKSISNLATRDATKTVVSRVSILYLAMGDRWCRTNSQKNLAAKVRLAFLIRLWVQHLLNSLTVNGKMLCNPPFG